MKLSNNIKKVIIAVVLLLSQFLTINSSHAGAVHFIDHDTFTTDTLSGLDWLDVTNTIGESYNYVSGQLGVGGKFEGWRYATGNELNKMVSNFTGTAFIENNYTQYQVSPGSIDNLFNLLGNTYFESLADPGLNLEWVRGLIADTPSGQQDVHFMSQISHENRRGGLHSDYVSVHAAFFDDDFDTMMFHPDGVVTSFLVRPVPVPAAIWFMGTGLVGLLGFSHKRMHVAT